MLAAAVAVARADGLEVPVPVTERYRDVVEADEDQWQRQVIDHLELQEWVRLDREDDNDLVGPTAREGLIRRGLLWPPAVQIKSNLLRQVGPGTLLTGEGGDEVFGARRASSWPHLNSRTPVSRRAAAHGAASSLLPRLVRERQVLAALRQAQLQPWLKPDVTEQHLRMVAADTASEPLRWDASLLWLTRRRGGALGAHNYRMVGAEHGVTVLDPFLDPSFLTALGRLGGRFGFAGRTETMRLLFGDLLPAAVVKRSTKSVFNRAFMGRPTREFAAGWDGSGVDESLVDPTRLREEWLSERPSALSSMLLQTAWLNTHSSSTAA